MVGKADRRIRHFFIWIPTMTPLSPATPSHSTPASARQSVPHPTLAARGKHGCRVGQIAARVRLATGAVLVSLMAAFAAPAHALDANSATEEQLQTLNGVGPRTAKVIVQERERGGPFESLADLSDRVRGIGSKRLARLQAAGLSVGAGVTVFSHDTIAVPQFAPALPAATPVMR